MHHAPLPDVKLVNVNHRASWQGAVSRYFHTIFKPSSFKNIFLSIITFGVYPYKKYKQAKHAVAQALAARKLAFFKTLREEIERCRAEKVHADPRQSLNAIFLHVQSLKVDESEEALEFKAIFHPSELLLFITNPIRDFKSIRLHRHKSRKRLDYLKIWHELKKKARINQYRQIQNINFCNKTLKEDYCITPTGTHDRLSRTSVYRKNSTLLTKFRELGKAFQEIVLAFQDFEDLKEENPHLYHLIDTLAKTSQKDIETLQTYLASRYLPRNLPLENRRQLIQLGNQQEVLSRMGKEEQFNLCALILNKYQWDFLLSIQEVSDVTLGLLDWAFEESPSTMAKELSFIERLKEGSKKKVIDDPGTFPTLNEKIKEDPSFGFMTVNFAKELNREWPSLHLVQEGGLFYEASKTEAFSMEKLLEVYTEMGKMAPIEAPLFSLLQEALSQVGKQAFQAAIEEGILKLLGVKSEYFLPIFSNSDIMVIKKSDKEVEIIYTFEQVITKRGEVQRSGKQEKYMVITQPLIQVGGKWTSLEAETKIAIKKKVA